MNDELDKAIQELIEAGVSDDEIKSFIRDYGPQQQQSVPDEAINTAAQAAAGAVNPIFDNPLGATVAKATARGINQGRQANVLTALQGDYSPEAAGTLADIQKQQEVLKPSKGYGEFNQSKTFGEALGKIFSSDGPEIITELSVESLAALLTAGAVRMGAGAAEGAGIGSVVPGIGTAAGAAVGSIAGLGLSSLNLEYSGSIMESLQEAGVNTKDPKSIIEAFADPDYLKTIREKALLKGVPIAIFDMASAGIAGRISKAVGAKTLGKKLLGNILEMSAQGALGGGGEVAGELAAGEELSPAGVLGEVVGEFGPGTVETAAGTIYHNKPESANLKVPVINEADYDVKVNDPIINNDLDITAIRDAKEIERITKDLDIDLTEAAPKSMAKVEPEINKIIEQVLPGTEIPKSSIQDIIGKPATVPEIPQPIAQPAQSETTTTEVAPEPLYRTSQNEMTNASKYGEQGRGGIMHTWQKGNNTSVGIFSVEPSMTGEIVPSNREDVLTPQGVAQEAHPAFKSKDFGPITTKIGLKKNLKLLKTRDTGMELHTDEIIKAAQKSKDVNQDALTLFLDKVKNLPDDKKQTVLAGFLRTRAGGLFDGITYKNKAETTAKPKRSTTITVAPEEDNITFTERADNIVKKRKPSQVISALENLRVRAEKKGLDKAIAHIDKQIEKFNEPEEEVVKKEKAPKPEKVVKEPKSITYKGTTKTLEAWKGLFYKQIGAAQSKNERDVRVAKYEEFREKSGLPKLKADRINQITKSDFAKKGEAKATKKAVAEEFEKIDEKAKEAFTKALGEVFDINPGEIEDLTFALNRSTLSANFAKQLSELNILGMEMHDISFEEFANLAPKSQQPILKALKKIISKYNEQQSRYIKVILPKGVAAPLLGFNFSIAKADKAYTVIMVDPTTNLPINYTEANTVLHEFIHEYTVMMFHRLYAGNVSFRNIVGITYSNIQSRVLDSIEKSLTKYVYGKDMTTADVDILAAIFTIMLSKEDRAYISRDLKALQDLISTSSIPVNKAVRTQVETAISAKASEIITQIYGLKNPHEMLAESFSSPNFMFFLSQFKMDSTITGGINKGTQKSLLYQWYEDLFTWVKKQFAHLELLPKDNNALDYLMNVVAGFDQEFVYGNLPREPDYGFNFGDPASRKELEDDIDIILFKKTTPKVKSLRKIVNNVSYTLEPNKDIKTLNDVKDYLTRVNKHLPASRKLDVDIYAAKILNRIKRIRKQREVAKQFQSKLVLNSKNRPEYKSSFKYKDDVDDFAAVNIDDLKVKVGNNEVMAYIAGLGNLSLNGVVDQRAYNIMIKYGKTLKMLNEILPEAKNLNQTFLKGLEEWANPASFSSMISKYKTKTANAVFKVIYGGSMKTMAAASVEASKFFKGLSEFAEKSKFTHKDLAKIGMYGGIFSTTTQPGTARYTEEILSNAKNTVEAARHKLTAKENENYRGDLTTKYIQNEIKIAEDILAQLTKGGVNTKILSDTQNNFYTKVKDFASQHEADFERNSVGNWGLKDFQKRWNYFPTLAQGSIEKGGQLREDELLRGEADNLFEATSTDGKRGTYGYIYGKKVWSNYRRTNPKGYFYENDALAIARRWSQSMLYDLYASKELKAINRLLEDPKFKQEFKIRTRDAFKNHLRSISSSGSRMDPETVGFLKPLLKVRDRLYTAALATQGQILLQSSSGFVTAAILSAKLNPITGVRSFGRAVKAASGSLGSMSKLQKFLEKEGLGIQLRDVLFEKYLTAEDYQNYLAAIKAKGIANKLENATEWALRSGDKLAARLVWFASYFDAGGTLENPSKEAVLEAERITGVMQNMSDMSFAAPAFKYNSTAKKILVGTLLAFKSFAINSMLNMYYSTRYSGTSKEARQVLAGQLGSILAYHTLAVMAIRPAYKYLTKQVFNGLGGDEGDQDEKRVGDVEQIVAESLWDAGVGMMMPQFIDALIRMAYNKTAAESIHGSEYYDYDQYADSPIYSVKEPRDLYKELLGPGFKEEAEFAIDATVLGIELAKADEYTEAIETTDKRNADLDAFTWKTIGTVYGGIQGAPFRGDVKRVLEGVARKKKSQHFNQ